MNSKHTANSKKVQTELREKFPKESDIIVNQNKLKGANYIKGRLMPSRSFGDLGLKHDFFNKLEYRQDHMNTSKHYPLKDFSGPYITHRPEIDVFKLQENSLGLLLATDG